VRAAAGALALDEDTIRELTGFKGVKAPVTSCYLDVDGRRYVRAHDYEVHLDRMLRPVREREHKAGHHSVSDDLKRIEERVKSGVDRSRTRGLAMFSCSAQDFWRSFDLPVPVRNRLVVNDTPQVRQLETIIAEHERFAVLLADRQRARLLVFQLGELVDKSERFDQLPRHEDDRGERVKDQVRDHVAVAAHQHLRGAAQVAFHVFQEQGFDHLIIGAPDEITGELERQLHSYVRERIAARLTVPVGARDEEIRQAALEVEEQIERTKEAALVERLRDAAGAGSGGLIGLDHVLEALVERRVDTLLVSEGFEAPGWRCQSCSFVGRTGPSCPVCGSRMSQVEDVVEEAVSEAVSQSCRVKVCRDNADLDVLGRVGALLRF
jgi:peptide subunit release factor 1 (eRF1)